jgi:hypothetical protein
MDDRALARWLAIREPLDAASRSVSLARDVLNAAGLHEPLRLADLATGTGSNIRYFLNRFSSGRQRWIAVDRSQTLLDELPLRLSAWAAERGHEVTRTRTGCVVRGTGLECEIDTRRADLATLPDTALSDVPHVITASALLDLVSDDWLRQLASHCRRLRCVALFTITYNGRSSCAPEDEDDELALRLFNRHQRTDKGLGGPAAGPDAVACVVRRFAEEGFIVRREPSDWHVTGGDNELQRYLIDGWAEAATEMDPEARTSIAAWRTRRLEHVESGRSTMIIGHDDVGAWLPAV